MSHSPFYDRRAQRLLSRVGDDFSQLRNDIGSLLHQTTRKTLPAGAKELAGQAREHLHAGSAFAASRLRALRSSPPQREAVGIAVGVVAIGLLAFGFYSLFKSKSPTPVPAPPQPPNAEDEDIPA